MTTLGGKAKQRREGVTVVARRSSGRIGSRAGAGAAIG